MYNPKISIIHQDLLAAESLASRLNAWPVKAKTINMLGQDLDALLKDLWFDKPDFVLVSPTPDADDWLELVHAIKADDELAGVRIFSFGDPDLATGSHPAIDRHLGLSKSEAHDLPAVLAKIILKSTLQNNVS